MTKKLITSTDPDIIASEKALRRAARRALEIGLKTGTPVYVIKKAKLLTLPRSIRVKPSENKVPNTPHSIPAVYSTATPLRLISGFPRFSREG